MQDKELLKSTFLLFDVDDTLIASHDTAFKKMQETARRLNITPPEEEAFRVCYSTNNFELAVSTLFRNIDVQAFCKVYDSLHQKYPDIPLITASKLIELKSLCAGIGILTNGPAAKTQRKLTAMGIPADKQESVFSIILSREELEFIKPDPRCFKKIASVTRLTSKTTFYIGDNIIDYHAAKGAGLGFIAVLSGLTSRLQFETAGLSPTYIIPSITSLLPCLRAALSSMP